MNVVLVGLGLCILGIMMLLYSVLLLVRAGYIEGHYILGPSMEPTYYAYDLLISVKTKHWELGRVYVYHAPVSAKKVIKRLVKIEQGYDGSSLLTFEGDNAEASDDSRRYGAVHERNVVGTVVAKTSLYRKYLNRRNKKHGAENSNTEGERQV